MTKQTKLFILSCVLLCILITPAYANAGTALMWGTAFYLLFVNLAIGIVEGLLLAWILKQRKILMILYLITANYVSAAIAYFLLSCFDWAWEDVTIYTIKTALIGLIVSSFILTILIEWPFIRLAIRKRKHSWRQALFASAIAQTFSYCILIPVYWHTEGLSLMREAAITHQSEHFDSSAAIVFFVGQGGNIYQISLAESTISKIHDFPQPHGEVILTLERNDLQDAGQLYAQMTVDGSLKPRKIPLPEVLCESHYHFFESLDEWEYYWDHKPYADFRDPNDRTWNIYSQYWAIEGLVCENEQTGVTFRIALDTPFLSWPAQRTFILPDNNVIFEFGQQICLFSPETRKLMLLAKGSYPVVVLNKDTE